MTTFKSERWNPLPMRWVAIFILSLLMVGSTSAALTNQGAVYFKFDNSVSQSDVFNHVINTTDSVQSLTAPAEGTVNYNQPPLIKVGQSFDFPTGNNCIAVPDVAAVDVSQNFTVTMWMNASSDTAGQEFLMARFSGGTGRSWFFARYPDNRLTFLTSPDGSTTFNAFSNATVSSQVPHFVAVVKQNDTATFYIDGVASGVDFAYPDISPSASVLSIGDIGASGDCDDSSGTENMIDEPALWNRSLSASEIGQLYAGGNGTQWPFGNDTTKPVVSNPKPANLSTFNQFTIVGINATMTDDTALASEEVAVTYPNATRRSFVLNALGGNVYGIDFSLTQIGNYSLQFNATDIAGNENSAVVTFQTVIAPDITPPSVTNPKPSNGQILTPLFTVGINATITDNVGLATTTVIVTYPNTTITRLVLNSLGGNVYGTSIVVTQNGTYTFRFNATDTAGNENSAVTTTAATPGPPIPPIPPSNFHPLNVTACAPQVEQSFAAIGFFMFFLVLTYGAITAALFGPKKENKGQTSTAAYIFFAIGVIMAIAMALTFLTGC